jgi:hypothetical protein
MVITVASGATLASLDAAAAALGLALLGALGCEPLCAEGVELCEEFEAADVAPLWAAAKDARATRPAATRRTLSMLKNTSTVFAGKKKC